MAFSALGCTEGCCLPWETQLHAGSDGLHISLPFRHEELRCGWDGVKSRAGSGEEERAAGERASGPELSPEERRWL